jgi:hypothetical protein
MMNQLRVTVIILCLLVREGSNVINLFWGLKHTFVLKRMKSTDSTIMISSSKAKNPSERRNDTQYNYTQHSDIRIMILCLTTLILITLNIMTFSIMTLSFATLSTMAFSIMTFRITTLSTRDLFTTLSINDTQHKEHSE